MLDTYFNFDLQLLYYLNNIKIINVYSFLLSYLFNSFKINN